MDSGVIVGIVIGIIIVLVILAVRKGGSGSSSRPSNVSRAQPPAPSDIADKHAAKAAATPPHRATKQQVAAKRAEVDRGKRIAEDKHMAGSRHASASPKMGKSAKGAPAPTPVKHAQDKTKHMKDVRVAKPDKDKGETKHASAPRPHKADKGKFASKDRPDDTGRGKLT